MKKRILIVEPSKSVAQLFEAELALQQFDTLTCSSINQAVKHIEVFQPDLILSAIELADGTGLELCQQLKRRPRSVLIPIILMTSKRGTTQADEAFAIGATDIIDKSSNMGFVIERIKSAVFHHSTIPYSSRVHSDHFTLLIAEDSEFQQRLYSELLTPLGYRLIQCYDGKSAWEQLQTERKQIDLVITDLHMPHINGEELCSLIRAQSWLDQVPLIVVTSSHEKESLTRLLQRGVTDYLTKPFCSEELITRLRTHLRNRFLFKEQDSLLQELEDSNRNLEQLIRERTADLQEANISTIYKLAVACDYRDQDTAMHINRVRHYVEELSRAAGLAEDLAIEMGYSSMMHDVGKIAIPEQILCKKAPLTLDEWQIMQQHTYKGADILGDSPFFKVAREIALFHHEKFDGSGYPHGLEGTDIPLSARIIAVVDIFDALTSVRSYKPAWEISLAVQELQNLSGSHLDPALVAIFISLQKAGKLDYIRERYPCERRIDVEMAIQLH